MNSDTRTFKISIFFIFAFALITQSLFAQFNVTNLNNTGAGSFRQAIIDINAAPGAGPFTLNINATGVVPVATALPVLAKSTTIVNGSDTLTLDGSATTGATGFEIQNAPNSQIRLIRIRGFQNGGLKIANSDGLTLENLVVGGNGGDQISLLNCNNGTIQKCKIGVNAAGTAAATLVGTITFGDLQNGLVLDNCDNWTISKNVVGSNPLNGIKLNASSTNTIINNFIGCNAVSTFSDLENNTIDLGNGVNPTLGGNGLQLTGNSSNNIVGGLDTTFANVFRSNGNNSSGNGIDVVSAGSDQNLFSHNFYLGNIIAGIKTLPTSGQGGNNDIGQPNIATASSCQIQGIALAGSRIELYASDVYFAGLDACQGNFVLLNPTTPIITQANDVWSYSGPDLANITGVEQITVIAIDPLNNTSEFAPCKGFCYVSIDIPDTAFCKNFNLSIDGAKFLKSSSGAGATFEWFLNGVSVGTAPTININTAGNYTVTVKGCGGCVYTDNFLVEEITSPNVTIENNDPSGQTILAFDAVNVFCDEDVQLKAVCDASGTTSSCDSYAWFYYENGARKQMVSTSDVSDAMGILVPGFTDAGRTDTVELVVHVLAASGKTCDIVKQVILNFDQKPAPNITPTDPCTPATLDANYSAPNATYLWSPNGETTKTINASVAGTYSVTVTSQGGCIESSSVEVKETPTLTSLVPANPGDCGFVKQETNPKIDGVTYTWYKEDPATNPNAEVIIAVTGSSGQPVTIQASDLKNPTVTGNTSQGQVWVVASKGNCKSAILLSNITIEDTLLVDLGANKEICLSENVTINAKSPSHPAGTTYQWLAILDGTTAEVPIPVSNTTSSITLPMAPVDVAGKHQIRVIVSDPQSPLSCKSNDVVEITLKSAPTLTLPADGQYCGEQEITPITNCVGCNYAWTKLGAGVVSTADKYTATATGIYALVITDPTNISCPARDTVQMTISELPQGSCTISPDEVEQNVPISFVSGTTDLTTQCKWEIFFGSNTTTPVLTKTDCIFQQDFEQDGQYKVKLTLTDAIGCEKELDCNFTVRPEPRLDFGNVITPNGDGINDVVKFDFTKSAFKTFKIAIFDRWGNELYASNDPAQQWDAKCGGGDCAPGVYYFTIETVNFKDKKFSRTGTFMLIK